MRNTCKGEKKSHVFWARILALVVFLFPLSLTHVDFRGVFQEALAIAPYKASPAYAAFADMHSTFNPPPEVIPVSTQTLAAGQMEMPPAPQAPVRRLALSGLTIHASDLAAHFQQNQTVIGYEAPPAQTETPVSEMANELAERALASEQTNRNEKIIRSITGTQIIVRRPSFGAVADNIRTPSVNNLKSDSPAPDPTAQPSTFATLAVNSNDPVTLSGNLELTGGLPFKGPQTPITVRRVYNGVTYEVGRVWTQDAKFQIHVKEPVGYLVAELKTQGGQVLGRGEVSLVDMSGMANARGQIQGVRLALRPTLAEASIAATSGRSPVTEARVDVQDYSNPTRVNDEGVLNDHSLMPNSTFVARAQAPKRWSSIVVGQSHKTQNIRLLSSSVIHALIDLNLKAADRQKALQSSIVWGEVLKNGKPLTGAVVQMAQGGTAIYFDAAYIPEKTQTQTGTNGLFAFLKIPPGVQAVRVQYGGTIYPAQVIPTEAGMVSYVELNVQDKAISHVHVFEALHFKHPIPARLRLFGNEKTIDTMGDDFIKYAMAADPFALEADGGPTYEVSRATVSGTPEQIFVPLIRRDWLTQLMNQAGIVQSQNLGVVVGLIDDQDFTAGMTGYSPQQPEQIVYFDAKGQPTQSQSGVAGGGFVIFNAPAGLQTVYIHPVQSSKTYSQVVMPEAGYVQVLTH